MISLHPGKKHCHSPKTVHIKVVDTVTLTCTSHFYKLRSLKIIRDPWDQKWNKLLMEDWVADTVCHHPWSIHNKLKGHRQECTLYFWSFFWKCSKEAEFWYIWTFVYLRNIVHFFVLVGIAFLRNKVCKTLHQKTALLTNLVEAVAYPGYI